MSTSAISYQNGQTLYGTYANRPSSALTGSIYTCSDGHVQFVYTGSVWAPVLDGVVGTQPPLSASFSTHLNWGSGTTMVDSQGTIYFSDYTTGGNENDHSSVMTTAGSTYTVTASFKPLFVPLSTGNSGAGLVITDGTKLIKWWTAYVSGGLTGQVVTLSNSTTFVANLFTQPLGISGNSHVWLKIQNNGTNRLYYFSADGINWYEVFSHATATFLTETEYGIVIAPLNSGGAGMTLESWATSSP